VPKYWNKLNVDIAFSLRSRAEISAANGDYIQASIIHAALLEAMLRIAITEITGVDRERYRKYWDGDAKFHQLVDYYELLGGNARLVDRLRAYNKARNRLVHRILEFKDEEMLNKVAKKNYEQSKELSAELVRRSNDSEEAAGD
jgi:hypothetical protein